MLIARKNRDIVDDWNVALSQKFKMKDLSPTTKILGIEILSDKTRRVLHLSQGGFIEKVLERFGMESAKPAA